MLKNFALLSLAFFACLSSAQDRWYRVRVATPDVETLQRLQDSGLNIEDCIPKLESNTVVVGPGEDAKLIAGGFRYSYIGTIDDPRNYLERYGESPQADYRTQYLTADQILAFYETLRAQYPALMTRQQIGSSINGEAIWAYRIGRNYGPISGYNNIVVLGLIHAREWISGSVVMHMTKMCVEKMAYLQQGGLARTLKRFMDNQALWVVPIHNIDGYRYSWTNNRLWRKNRRNNGGGQFGVDLNRNYSKGWGLNGGSSGNTSSETYRGTAAFSEPESRAVRDLVATLPRIGGMIDFHSYSQLVLWPWGYTSTTVPDAAMFQSFGNAMVPAFSSLGKTYVGGQTSQILYIASGTSNDYVYDIKRTACMALELRDTGEFGFELPPNQITPCQDESWAGFQAFLAKIPK